jgi:hypothetical protein
VFVGVWFFKVTVSALAGAAIFSIAALVFRRRTVTA